MERDRDQKLRALKQSAKRKLVHRLNGMKVEERYLRSENGQSDIGSMAAGDTLTTSPVEAFELDEFEMLTYEDVEVESEIWDIVDEVAAKSREIERLHDEKVERQQG